MEEDPTGANMDFQHPDALLTYFQHLHQTGQFVDVTMQCDGEVVTCGHRLVLAAFSTHFETALAGVGHSSTITLDIDPKITGVGITHLREIADFMYTGRATNTDILVESARALGCVSLVQLLESEEARSVPEAVVEDAAHSIRLLQAAYRFKIDGRFTDVTINCQNTPVTKCHRLVLCAYSEHFESALVDTENSSMVTLDIDSAITGINSSDLRCMVDFMYTGVLRAQRRRLRPLRSAALTLGVGKMVDVIDSLKIVPLTGSSAAASGVMNMNDMDDHQRASIGANVDIGSSSMRHSNHHRSGVMDDEVLMDDPDSADYGMSDDQGARGEMTGNEDYVDIYEEYVAGPRRGRKGGTYGRKQEPIRIKGSVQRYVAYPDDPMTAASSSGGGGGSLGEGIPGMAFFEGNELIGGGGPSSSDAESISAVTMSCMPTGKRRRMTDSFGYGLPEIVGANDVTVPLLVGDQQAMMEKPFKCPYCDHRTKEKSAVEKHIRCIHTLEAPYKCRYCNQAFKVQSNLVRHIRAHTGEKPYVCKKCGAAYADKKNMDAHVFREHLKAKPLECPEPGCSAKFWRQDRFQYHCRKAHSYETMSLEDD